MISTSRFLLETFTDGGLLLDLEEGFFFRLNHSATFVWERTMAGMSQVDVAAALTGAFGLPESVARQDVAAALVLPEGQALPPHTTDSRYEQTHEGYRLSEGPRVLFEISADGTRLRLGSAFGSGEIGPYLRAISPKLLALKGLSVLHAGAVVRPDGRLTAFLGTGGAGKTTSARAFEQGAGWRLVCEDKLVLASDGAPAMAAIEGEARITQWIREMRTRLETVSGDWCQTDGLEAAASGPAAFLDEIVLVSASRRLGNRLRLRRLAPVEAAGEIFRNGFYGSTAAGEWKRQLGRAAEIARVAQTYETTMPNTIEALAEAASAYIAMKAS